MDLVGIEPNPSEEGEPLKDSEIPPSIEETKFQRAIAAWKSVNLSSLIHQLDTTASEIINHQKDALVERKDVAQKTKDFRKLDDPSKLTEYKTLLKAYQTFIDLITSHGKESSSAFLQVYQTLAEAPDPFPLLEASVDSLVLSEDTVPRLTAENEDLQKRVKRLTGQLDETEKRVQNEIKTRKDVESGSGDLLQEVEANWTKAMEEKQNNWIAKEQALEEKVENQDRLIKELKASYEVSQRLGQDTDESNSSNKRAANAELEMMSSELERTSARLGEIEARNERLRVELAQMTSQNTANQSLEDDANFLRLQSENSSLLRRLDSVRFERDSEKRVWNEKVKQIERQRMQMSTEMEELHKKTQKWSDYDEIRRELDMLRSIELSVEDEDSPEDHGMNGSAVNGKVESLEHLLLSRNKKLTNDLTLLRVSRQEMEQQLNDLRDELSNTNAELEKSQNLSASLENDLLKMQEEASNVLPSSGISVAGTYTSRYPHSSRRGRASPTSSIISGYDAQRQSGTTSLESLKSGDPVGGGSGILPMIQAQRDRFKQKNQQLEEELSKQYATVTSLRQEIASLQKDNLSLYEKSRYVSAYSRGSNAASSSAYSQEPSRTAVYTDGDSTDRWKSQYEANISPFAAFRGRESARAYKRMNLPERAVFSLTRIVLATRISRNLFAGYCLSLHFLIFLMLYWTGTTESEKHPQFSAPGDYRI